ncbi:hypothetical protein OSB04_023682 [Centaurea solstitialis]|uniref:Retrovirus-related Pol polyprotein from transposon TNT 1-94 n=1 Tax=Centaurea solstitialis TaxID=347529 RepID=A0AA38SJP7_9ASTR|nr:hypothetical protein OSB04_023682 [Centaurea solstitialis]
MPRFPRFVSFDAQGQVWTKERPRFEASREDVCETILINSRFPFAQIVHLQIKLYVVTKTQLADFEYTMERILIYCDSKSAIQITANPVQHSRTKHIDIRYHFIKDHVEKGNIELYFVESDLQLADLFTKSFDE